MRTEVRTCIKCGETKDIIQRHKHATNTCDDCQRERAKEYQRAEAIREGRRVGVTGRWPYPLEDKWDYPNQKFNAMAKKMKYMEDREEWVEQIKINLDETINNPLVMEWINAHKADDVKTGKGRGRIAKDYPDTRGMTWEDYMKGLEEDDVDS